VIALYNKTVRRVGIAHRLVRIVENVPAEESFGGGAQQRNSLNVAELDDWRKSRTLSHVALVGGLEGHTLTTPAGAMQIYGARVSPALFAMRGVQALLEYLHAQGGATLLDPPGNGVGFGGGEHRAGRAVLGRQDHL